MRGLLSLGALLTVLALGACDTNVVFYGVEGTVTRGTAGVPGIRVVCATGRDLERAGIGVTDDNGDFSCRVDASGGGVLPPPTERVIVVFDDVDGEENGGPFDAVSRAVDVDPDGIGAVSHDFDAPSDLEDATGIEGPDFTGIGLPPPEEG